MWYSNLSWPPQQPKTSWQVRLRGPSKVTLSSEGHILWLWKLIADIVRDDHDLLPLALQRIPAQKWISGERADIDTVRETADLSSSRQWQYQILSHVVARCTSQKAHGHARIARVSCPCAFWLVQRAKKWHKSYQYYAGSDQGQLEQLIFLVELRHWCNLATHCSVFMQLCLRIAHLFSGVEDSIQSATEAKGEGLGAGPLREPTISNCRQMSVMSLQQCSSMMAKQWFVSPANWGL